MDTGSVNRVADEDEEGSKSSSEPDPEYTSSDADYYLSDSLGERIIKRAQITNKRNREDKQALTRKEHLERDLERSNIDLERATKSYQSLKRRHEFATDNDHNIRERTKFVERLVDLCLAGLARVESLQGDVRDSEQKIKDYNEKDHLPTEPWARWKSNSDNGHNSADNTDTDNGDHRRYEYGHPFERVLRTSDEGEEDFNDGQDSDDDGRPDGKRAMESMRSGTGKRGKSRESGGSTARDSSQRGRGVSRARGSRQGEGGGPAARRTIERGEGGGSAARRTIERGEGGGPAARRTIERGEGGGPAARRTTEGGSRRTEETRGGSSSAIRGSSRNRTSGGSPKSESGGAGGSVQRRSAVMHSGPPNFRDAAFEKPNDDGFRCPLCHKQFSRPSDVTRHLEKCPGQMTEEYAATRYHCNPCAVSFVSVSSYNRHKKHDCRYRHLNP